jgi:hypothetical protein
MPILSLDALPWVLLAIVVARSLLTAGRLAVMREQLAETHERLRKALAALEGKPVKAEASAAETAKHDELHDAVRVALEVVRRDAPQRVDNFTKVS